MAWRIELLPDALADLKKLDRQMQRRILDFLGDRIAPIDDPRSIGQALRGPLGRFWKYRVGDYRIICEIHDQAVTVLIAHVGNRKNVYR